MHRIDSANAVNGRFVAGNPVTGQRPTTHTAAHDNAMQDEICAVIEAAGITLDKGANDQLLLAINALIDQRIAAALEGISLGGSSGTVTCQQVAAILANYASITPADGTLVINCPDQPDTTPSSLTLSPDSGILAAEVAGETAFDPNTGELSITDTATETYTYTYPDLEVNN